MTSRARQQGATLMLVMIMLIMLTLFAVSAMNQGTMNLKVVGNMQQRSEALEATQWMIDSVISATQFVDSPTNAVPNPCGTPNTLCSDVNGDGIADYTTKLDPVPACVQARAIKIGELNLSPTSEDLACVTAQAQGTFGVSGATASGDSLCASTVWEITANTLDAGATAATSSVNVTTTHGVSVRVKALDMAANCP